jgi:hypothetical protein
MDSFAMTDKQVAALLQTGSLIEILYRRIAMKKRYQSEILGVIHQDAQSMFEVGAISEERMREYDRDCLAPEVSVVQMAKRSGSSYVPMKSSRVYASKAD